MSRFWTPAHRHRREGCDLWLKSKDLDDCGCCEGITALTPQALANPPGLGALAYRAGTHGTFKASMLANLAGPGGIPALTTRADDDPAVALLDATAILLDVLTFYEERIANEGYLRTATERMSLLELARTIGYELRPGVAASTYLAFEMETAPTAPAAAMIPVGTKVQSLPGQNETPQTFETVEPIEARPQWNRLLPRSVRPRPPRRGDKWLVLQGTATNLKPGDALLILGDERRQDVADENWALRLVTAVRTVTPPRDGAYTVVRLDQPLDFAQRTLQNPSVFALRQRANLFGHNASDWRTMSISVKATYLGLDETADREEILEYTDWPGFTVAAVADMPTAPSSGKGLYGEYYDGLYGEYYGLNMPDPVSISDGEIIDFEWRPHGPRSWMHLWHFAVRWTGAVEPSVTGKHKFFVDTDGSVRLWVNGRLLIDRKFGEVGQSSGAITLRSGCKYDVKLEYDHQSGGEHIRVQWAPPHSSSAEVIPARQLYPRVTNTLHLDTAYPRLLPGSWLVLETPDAQEAYQIAAAAEMSRAAFLLSARTTQLTLAGENLRGQFNDRLRATTVFAASEELAVAGRPIRTPVQGTRIVLDRRLPALQARRTVIVSGKRTRVAVKRAQQAISAADGVSTVDLAIGDSLLLARTPELLPGRLIRLTLIDKNGVSCTLTLGSCAEALAAFRLTSAKADDAIVSEVAVIVEVPPGKNPTVIVLEKPLLHSYDRATVTIYGNVAAATHGETRREVLGSGDAARGFQRFVLKQKPLTYVAATTAGGAASTLQVRVNDVLWQEAPSLYDLPARERAYITRRDDDGNVTITFGDGATGARLPAGSENVVAAYRVGIGAAGMVKPDQLSLLLTRPLGVQKVANPLAPAGAADPENA